MKTAHRILALIGVLAIWLVYSSLFLCSPYRLDCFVNVPKLLVDTLNWNLNNIKGLFYGLSAKTLTNPTADFSYSVYLLSFAIFLLYFYRWVEDTVRENERKPRPLYIRGKQISESVTCNPQEEEFETIDKSIRTITDIRNRFSTFGDRGAIYFGGDWKSYSYILQLSEIMGNIVKTYSKTDAPLCVMGDFSSIKCSAILGVTSAGRSVVFLPYDCDSAEMASVIEEQHCEVLLVKRSRLCQLEDALDTSYCKSLRVILYTECDYLEKIEMGDLLRVEETLIQEYNLTIVSLGHVMETEYKDHVVTEKLDVPEGLEDRPAVIMYNSNKEPITLTHRNIVAAASALVHEYQITENDIILAEPVSVASTISLFMACMMCGARFSITDKIMTICGEVQPTVISASNTTYFSIYKELVRVYKKHVVNRILLAPLRHLFRNTQYFRVVRQKRVAQLLGDNLRLCLSFYSYRPLSSAGHSLLCKMTGVPVSIIFGNTETCGVCTHSVEGKHGIGVTYVAMPFVCNSLRKSERNTLLISGSNIAENSRMVELDGIRWFDSGLSIPFMKNHYILHKMPTTYDSTMPI